MKRSLIVLTLMFFSLYSTLTGVNFFSREDVVYAQTYNVPQAFAETIKTIQYGQPATTINNVLVYVNFSGEENNLSDEKTIYDNKEAYKIVEDIYNNSEYSVKNYFYLTSNKKIEMNTLFLYNESEGTPFTLDKTRDYYNSQLISVFQSDILNKISTQLDSFADDYDLDVNNDGYIDSITFMLTESDLAVDWSDPLWAHSSRITTSKTITDKDGTLKFGKYC